MAMPDDDGPERGKHRKLQTCSVCGGTGKVTWNDDGREEERTCTTCHGAGQI